VQSLGSCRKRLYRETVDELMLGGFTEGQLEESAFCMVKERLAVMDGYESPKFE